MDGNQIFGTGAETLALDALEPPVSRAVRTEGAGFYLHRRVTVVAKDTRRVRAVVRGPRPYDVTIAGGGEGKVAVGCDCVTFREERTVCRHIWATLIKVQNEDLLPAPGPPALAGIGR